MLYVLELYQDNIEDIVRLAQMHHEELGEGSRAFSADSVRKSCYDCIADIDRRHVNAWIVYSGKEPVGYLVATASRYFQSEEWLAKQEYVFVAKTFRITRAMLMLVEVFEEWAADMGCVRTIMGVEHPELSKMVEKIGRSMQRVGYDHKGMYYVKELQ